MLIATPNLTELHLTPLNPWNINYGELWKSLQALGRARQARSILTHLTLHSKLLAVGGLVPEAFFNLPVQLPHLESLAMDLDCTAAITGCVQQALRDAESEAAGAAEGQAQAYKFVHCRHLSLQLQGLSKKMGTLRMTTEHGFRGIVIQSEEQQEQQKQQTNEKVRVLFRLLAFHFPSLEILSMTVQTAGPTKKTRREGVEGQRPAPPPHLPVSVRELRGLKSLCLFGFDFSDAAALFDDGDAAWLQALERARFHGSGASGFAERVKRLAPRALVAAREPGGLGKADAGACVAGGAMECFQDDDEDMDERDEEDVEDVEDEKDEDKAENREVRAIRRDVMAFCTSSPIFFPPSFVFSRPISL